MSARPGRGRCSTSASGASQGAHGKPGLCQEVLGWIELKHAFTFLSVGPERGLSVQRHSRGRRRDGEELPVAEVPALPLLPSCW